MRLSWECSWFKKHSGKRRVNGQCIKVDGDVNVGVGVGVGVGVDVDDDDDDDDDDGTFHKWKFTGTMATNTAVLHLRVFHFQIGMMINNGYFFHVSARANSQLIIY